MSQTNETCVTMPFYAKPKKETIKLNLRERRILGELEFGKTLRLSEYCERLTVNERQARCDLGDLVDGGWLEREGEGPVTLFRRTGKEWHPAKPGQIRLCRLGWPCSGRVSDGDT
jgi:hypothetical protein